MVLKFAEWLFVREGSQLMGTAGTIPGDPTPTGAAPKNKVSAPSAEGSGGGPGKSNPSKADGCSGGPCPPRTQATTVAMGGGGGGGAASAAPAGGAAPK